MARHDAEIAAVTALLGPTNTGKTHLAVERMLAHRTGMMGLRRYVSRGGLQILG